jgi:hypothetical protein
MVRFAVCDPELRGRSQAFRGVLHGVVMKSRAGVRVVGRLIIFLLVSPATLADAQTLVRFSCRVI